MPTKESKSSQRKKKKISGTKNLILENEIKETDKEIDNETDNETDKIAEISGENVKESNAESEETKNKEIEKDINKEESQEETKKEPEDESNIQEVNNKELIKSNLNVIAKVEEPPEYIKEMIKKRKRIRSLFITIVLSIVSIIAISTSFAILNMNSSKIISGITIKNIDVSNMSKQDAINKLTEAMNKELIAEINLEYGNDYRATLKPEQIEFAYKVEEAIDNAYSIGRQGNILIDNYTIIYTLFAGKNIEIKYTYNEELLNQFVGDLNAKLPGLVVEPTYYIEENQLFVNKGTNGIRISENRLKEKIIQSILARRATILTDGFNQTLEIPIEEAEASAINMKAIHEEIYRKPQNAYYEKEPYKIYPDVDGVDLAISVEEAQNIILEEDKQEYIFDLKITKAEKTLDDLGTEAFPYLISQFSTKYDASNRNRSTNLQIAAEKINGKVLMPGEEFSFNKIVGKRTVEEGYKDAAIYADGGVVDGLAGGICQISSTLYNSVLLANLQIAERRNHSFTTSYSPAGRDATVVWGKTDFRFINSRSYPIKIEATVKNGIAEFKLYGMQEEVEYEVRILPVRTQSIPYTTTYEQDATLIPGQQIIKQSGHAGCKVTTYKELRLNGEVISKEPISNDTYQPMRTIIRVAPGQVPQ
ncbi:MAG: VanW family protein [Clostridia bacterium]|nr:VanW family protein [Clostridia bacterium]